MNLTLLSEPFLCLVGCIFKSEEEMKKGLGRIKYLISLSKLRGKKCLVSFSQYLERQPIILLFSLSRGKRMVWSRISREIPKKKTKAFLILHHYIFINDIEIYASVWYYSILAIAFYLSLGYKSQFLHSKPWQLGVTSVNLLPAYTRGTHTSGGCFEHQ